MNQANLGQRYSYMSHGTFQDDESIQDSRYFGQSVFDFECPFDMQSNAEYEAQNQLVSPNAGLFFENEDIFSPM
jgi:hypothetical protein